MSLAITVPKLFMVERFDEKTCGGGGHVAVYLVKRLGVKDMSVLKTN